MTSSTVVGLECGICSRAPATTSKMPVNPSRWCRNASTATSSAALRTAGAEPPLRPASKAISRDGLRAAEGRLYLTGITEAVYDQVVRTKKLRLTGPVRAYEATDTLLQSTEEAVAEARMWLVDQGVEPPEGVYL